MINIRDLIVNQGFAKAILGGGAAEPPEIKLQEKTITENGEYTADDGFDGLLKVLVDVASSGKEVKIGRQTLTAKNGKFWHELGVIPDCVMVFGTCYGNANTITKDGTLFAYSQKTGSGIMGREEIGVKRVNGTLMCVTNALSGFDGSSPSLIKEVDERSVTISEPLMANDGTASYYCIAFSGLL